MLKNVRLTKALIALAMFAAVTIQAGCGTDQSAQNRVGPTGPTSPNGYYFDLTVTPSTVQSGANIDVQFRVWDSSGNTAAGVTGFISGTGIDVKKAAATTGTDGWAGWLIQLKNTAGSIVFVTVSVEDLSLTAPVQVMTGSSSGTT